MAIGIGPIIPGLGVNYTSPAAKPATKNNTTWTYYDPRTATTSTSKVTTPRVSPATAASALGLSNAKPTGVPTSLQPVQKASQTTLIPAALDAAGRAGGANVSTTNTGAVRATPPVPSIADSDYARTPGANLPGGVAPIPSGRSSESGLPATAGGGGSAAGGAAGGGAAGGGVDAGSQAGTGGTSGIDAAKALDAAIRALLDPEFIGFQGDRAAELRRLQNLRNQLFGDTKTGLTGSVQRQQTLDANARRRLAAQRAASGMLQGGAYYGRERGLGTIQRADQDFAMQEMLRPFTEQTAADRLREFGLEYDPASRAFDLTEFTGILPEYTLNPETGELEYVAKEGDNFFGLSTYAGREAAARAKQQALQQLMQQGIQI